MANKYQLDEVVYFIECNKIVADRIVRIRKLITKGESEKVFYDTQDYDNIKEERCYKTREDLISSL